MYLIYRLLVVVSALELSMTGKIYQPIHDDTQLMKTVAQVLSDFSQRPHESILLATKPGNYIGSWFPLTRPVIINGGRDFQDYCSTAYNGYGVTFKIDYRCYCRLVAYFSVGTEFTDGTLGNYWRNRDNIIVYFNREDILSRHHRESLWDFVRSMVEHRVFKLLVIGGDHAVYAKVFDPNCTKNFALLTIGDVGNVNDSKMIKWKVDLQEIINFYDNLSPRYCTVSVCTTVEYPRLIKDAINRQKNISTLDFVYSIPNIHFYCNLALKFTFLDLDSLDDTYVDYRHLFFIVLKSGPIPPWRTFTMILSRQIWTLTAVTFVTVAATWWWLNPREKFTSSLWKFFYSILGYGISHISGRFPARCLSLAWFFFVIHFLLFFSTDYFDFLTTPVYERQIKTVHEIVSNGFEVYGHAEYAETVRDYIPNYKIKTGKEMKFLYPEHKTAIMVDNFFFYISYVKNLARQVKTKPVYVIKDWVFSKTMGNYATASFRDEFKRIILQAHACGAIEHTDSLIRIDTEKKFEKDSFAEATVVISLQFQHIILPLLFVVAASVVGILTLGLEIVYHIIRRPATVNFKMDCTFQYAQVNEQAKNYETMMALDSMWAVAFSVLGFFLETDKVDERSKIGSVY